MATATFTTVVSRVDAQLTNAIWADQLQDNLNQLASAHRNLLTNGGFEVWQRGAGAFTTDLAYTADRWRLGLAVGNTASITREATTIDSSGVYALACAYTVGGAASVIYQQIENWQDFKGKDVSFSIRIRQSAASMVRIQIGDGVGVTSSTAVATTGSFVTHTVTRTISASATGLTVYVEMSVTGTCYLDNAMLVLGPAPAPYRPLHPQEELARCQRYYEVLTAELAANGTAGQTLGYTVPFAVEKAVNPTITKVGTWGVVNCGQPTSISRAGGEKRGVTIFTTVTATALAQFFPNSSDDVFTVESNP